jgi:hypothetical protein
VGLRAHLFVAEENPSTGSDRQPGLGTALDRDRLGLELAAEWSRRLRAGDLGLVAGGIAERVDTPREDTVTRWTGFAGARVRRGDSWGKWNLFEALRLDYQAGRTGEDDWTRGGGELLAGAGYGRRNVVVSYRRRAADGASRAIDALHLGGLESGLIPRSALTSRILDPALPPAIRTGDRYEGWRLELPGAIVEDTRLFAQRHRVWYDGGAKGEWLDLVGLEWGFRAGPESLLRIPWIEVRVGVARILDPPLEDRTRGWLNVVYRP